MSKSRLMRQLLRSSDQDGLLYRQTRRYNKININFNLMRKHLLVTLLLTCGVPYSGQMMFAVANPEPQSQSQTVTIKGTVFDENNEPVVGASVTPKGSTKGVSTDVDGNFAISVAPGSQLKITTVGYKEVIMKAAQGMSVYLQPTTEVLDQLVVVGYGSQKRANLTGAVSTVDVARTMSNRPETDIAKALQGAVPGLTILNNTGNITGNPVVQIRGVGTLTNSGGSPLYVVDGVAMDDISFLNPEDIKEISVLKDAASSSIYGARAAFGVLLITTKGGEKQDRVQVKYSNNFGWSQGAVLPKIQDNVSSLEAMIEAAKMLGPTQGEFFGQYYTDMLPYAKKWQLENRKNGRINTYRELRPYVDENNVGDYYLSPNGTTLLSYADYDINAIMINDAAPSNSHNASISGSTGRATYDVSFGYASRQSLSNFNPDRMKRYNAKVDLKLDVTDWLTAGVRMSYSQRDIQYPNVGSNIWGTIWRFPGFYQMLGYTVVDGEKADWRNEIAYLKQADNVKSQRQYTRMQAYVQAQIIKGLTLNADFTYSTYNRNDAYAYLPVNCIDNWFGPYGYPTECLSMSSSTATKYNEKENRWAFNVYGTYDFGFNNNNFKVMVGSNVEKNVSGNFQARTKVLLDVNLPALNLYTGDLVAPTNYDGHWATAGFFGRINYDYKGIYLAEFNGRYDGSSRFPANDQWAFFSSGSVGYRFSEEGYFKPLKSWWSNGKLRASYGEIGNQAVGDNRFISTITTRNINYLNQSTGVLVNAAAMPALVSSSLTWERICTTDVGIDLGFLNNSLTASFDWYQRDTKDMLAPGVELPQVLGASAPYGNHGSLRTRGWELTLGWNKSFGDWDVYASFNIADSKTKITKWNNPSMSLTDNYSGMEYGAIWGLETDRYYTKDDFQTAADGSFLTDDKGNFIPKPGIVDQREIANGSFHYGPGDVMFVDQNGDGKINGGAGKVGDQGDVVKIGNSLPRYEYGFHLGGAWKGIDLDIFCQGVGKRDMWTVSSMVVPFTQAANDIYYDGMESHNKVIYDSNWNIVDYEVNQANKFARIYPGAYGANNVNGIALSGTYNYIPQTRYLQDMSYLRVKNITVGYTLPYAWTSKAYIQKARIYFSGENLFFIHQGNKGSNFDPEIVTTEWSGANTIGRANPIPRTYSFGLQVTF